MASLKDIIDYLEARYPASMAEEWDHIGLQVGSVNQQVTSVLCALDVTDGVIEEAIQLGANVIITHHPFLFKALAKIDLDAEKGKQIQKLLLNNISVVSMHTNFDIAPGGLNDYLATLLQLQDVKVLATTKKLPYYKCAVYVPNTHTEIVKDAIIRTNTTCLGNYTGCTFSMLGTGTFMPLEKSNPAIGSKGVLEHVAEEKITFVVASTVLDTVLEAIKAVHPYEEVAFDVYTLHNLTYDIGLGRIGDIAPISVNALIDQVKKVFSCTTVRLIGDRKEAIKKVAICSGSGGDFIGTAAKKADVYITGDVSFHQAQQAVAMGLTVIDVGHYHSENIAIPHMAEQIKQAFTSIEVATSNVNGSVFLTL